MGCKKKRRFAFVSSSIADQLLLNGTSIYHCEVGKLLYSSVVRDGEVSPSTNPLGAMDPP